MVENILKEPQYVLLFLRAIYKNPLENGAEGSKWLPNALLVQFKIALGTRYFMNTSSNFCSTIIF